MESISIELRKTMALNIEYQLKKAGKSQREMCISLGFKENTVSDWMNARTYPRIDKVEMMANFFNCRKSDLIERYPELGDNKLTIPEQELLDWFRRLNEEGKEAAAIAVKNCTFNPEYRIDAEKEKITSA